MACTQPKRAWKSGLTKNGKQKLVFTRPKYSNAEEQKVPCGKCVSCKLDYSREWAIRIQHEAQTALISCFLTLTYNDENIPEDRSVDVREIQLFIKKLRKKIYPAKIKYFACGEYGNKKTQNNRPHYHVIIMGYDFIDKRLWKTTDSGQKIYRSNELEKIWTKGYSSIGEVTFQSAAYVARYTLKKTKDKKGYEHVDTDTGEINDLKPEFLTMSQGIGKTWWNKYKTDTNKDYLLNEALQKTKVPRYYDKQREKEDPDSLEEIKLRREEKAKEQEKENTIRRKMAKRKVKETQSKQLIRGYENGEN